jgi:hypothetical protein
LSGRRPKDSAPPGRPNTDDEHRVVDHTSRYRRVEQQSAFLLQHRQPDAKISAGGTSG